MYFIFEVLKITKNEGQKPDLNLKKIYFTITAATPYRQVDNKTEQSAKTCVASRKYHGLTQFQTFSTAIVI